MIDSSKWEVIEAGLRCIRGKAVVSYISLKEGEAFIKRAKTACATAPPWWLWPLTKPARPIPTSARPRSANVPRCAASIGFNPSDGIFDPNIFAIATGIENGNYAVDFINARWIRENLPASISGGVGNVSFSFRGNGHRARSHPRCSCTAIKAGMNMGIMKPGQLVIYDEIEPDLKELVETWC